MFVRAYLCVDAYVDIRMVESIGATCRENGTSTKEKLVITSVFHTIALILLLFFFAAVWKMHSFCLLFLFSYFKGVNMFC